MKKKERQKLMKKRNWFRKSWIVTLAIGMIFGVFAVDINAVEDTSEMSEVTEEKIVGFTELVDSTKTQKIEVGGNFEELDFPTELSAQFSSSGKLLEKKIAVTWDCGTTFDAAVPGTYVFSANVGNDYSLEEGIKLPTIEIIVAEKAIVSNNDLQSEKMTPIINNFATATQVDVTAKTVSAIQSEIVQALKKNKKIEVIGTNRSINGTLTLSLSSGEELVWNAEYLGTYSKNNMMIINQGGIFSEGTFIIGSNAIIKGQKSGAISNDDVMISSHVDIEVKPGARVTCENNATIRLEDLYDKIVVDGGTIVSNSAFATIDAPSVMTALSDKITIKGNSFIQNTGTGMAIYSHSGYVRVEGGQVLATTKEAIRMDGFFASTVLSGGVVFAYGKTFEGVNQVIDNFWGSFDIKQTGTVIAYDNSKAATSYAYGSTTNINITPRGSTAVWSIQNGQSGIAYANKNNSGFIPVDVIVEKLPLTTNDFKYTIPKDDRYNEQKQGLKDISCTKADYLTSGGVISLVYKQNGKEVEPINAGSYDVYLSASGSNLYTDVASTYIGTYTIKKAEELSVIWPTNATDIVYGDTLSKSTLKDATHKYGVFEWVNPQTRYNAGTHRADVKFVANDLAILNYKKLPSNTKKVEVSVKKAKVTGLEKDFNIYAEYSHKYEMDLASLLPTLDQQLTYGNTLSTLVISQDRGRILDQRATKINTRTGKVEIQSNNVRLTNSKAIIKITIQSQNYEDITSTITVKVINKKELNVSNIMIEKTYDGARNSEVEVGRGGIKLIGIDKNDDVKIVGTPRATFPRADIGKYNDIELSGLSLTGKDAGKYKLSLRGYSGIIKAKAINDKDVKIEVKDTNLVYDGDVKKPDVKITYNKMQLIEGRDYSIAYRNNVNAGDNSAEMTITGKGNYTALVNRKFSIQKKKVTVQSIGAIDREYDGTTKVQLCGGKLNGIIKQDQRDVKLKLGDGTLVDGKDASSKAKKVIIDNVTIVGKKANNYEIDKNATQATTTAMIYKRLLIINKLVVDDKVYDGTTKANVSFITFKNVVANENLKANKDYIVQATFENGNVGNKKVFVAVDFSNKHDSVGRNYTIDDSVAYAKIKPKKLDSKDIKVQLDDHGLIYNGNSQKAKTEVSLNGKKLESKDYTLTYDNNVNAGNNTARVTIKGAGNFTGTVSKRYSIQKKIVTFDGITAVNREYDGTDKVKLNRGKIHGLVRKDEKFVSLDYKMGTLQDGKDASSRKKIVKINNVTLIGEKANNYKIDTKKSQNETSVTIRKKMLVVNSVVADDKIYDGTTTANISKISFKHVVMKEKLRNGKDYKITANFTDEHVGANKDVKVHIEFNNKLNSAGKNYIIKDFSTTANITAKEITGSVTIEVRHEGTNSPNKIGENDVLVANTEQIINNDENATLEYQWYRDGEAIDTATEKEYTIQSQLIDEVESKITVRVRGVSNYTGTLESNAIMIDKLDLELDFDIQGNTRVNTSLNLDIRDANVNRRALYNADKKYEVRWYRGDEEIIDAYDELAYIVQMSDIGETITVEITGVGIYDGKISKTITVATPTEPSEVQNLTVMPKNGKVTLKWENPIDDGGIDLQKFEVSVDNGVWTNLDLNREHTVTGLVNNKTYTFKVRVTNNYGLTSTSTVVQGKPVGEINSHTDKISARLAPKTGDSTSIESWSGLLSSSLGLALLILLKRKNNYTR